MNKESALIEYICGLIPKFTSCNAMFEYYKTDNARPKPTKGATQFKEWHKKAENVYLERQQAINKEVKSNTIENEIEAKKQALNAIKAMDAILIEKFNDISKIKKGNFNVKDQNGNIIDKFKVTVADELKAVDTLCKLHERLNKKHGTDAPTKIAETDTEGNDKLNKNDIKELFEKIDKINNE